MTISGCVNIHTKLSMPTKSEPFAVCLLKKARMVVRIAG